MPQKTTAFCICGSFKKHRRCRMPLKLLRAPCVCDMYVLAYLQSPEMTPSEEITASLCLPCQYLPPSPGGGRRSVCSAKQAGCLGQPLCHQRSLMAEPERPPPRLCLSALHAVTRTAQQSTHGALPNQSVDPRPAVSAEWPGVLAEAPLRLEVLPT